MSETNLLLPRPKRVRRKHMDVQTFARFVNRLGELIQEAVNEFDPTPEETESAIGCIRNAASRFVSTTKRRTS